MSFIHAAFAWSEYQGCLDAVIAEPPQETLLFDRRWVGSLDAALDKVRDRFGASAITRAVLIGRDQGLTIRLLPGVKGRPSVVITGPRLIRRADQTLTSPDLTAYARVWDVLSHPGDRLVVSWTRGELKP